MTMKGETLDFPVTATGASKASDDINRVGQSMTKSAGEWDKMSGKASKASAALGAMSNALGPLGANFGILGQSISRASGIISSMTSLIGGPWSIAIGAAAIGIGILAKKMSEAKDKADDLRKAMVEQWAAEAEIERKRRADERAADAEQKRAAEQGAADFTGRAQSEGLYTVGGKGKGGKKGGRGGGGFRPSDTQFGDASDFEETADPFATETNADQMREMSESILAEQAKLDEQKLAQEERFLASMDRLRDQQFALDAARMEEKRRLEERHHEFVSGMLEDQGRLAIRAANESAKGHAMGKKAALQSIGDALVARGTAAIAEGGIWSAVPFMWGSGTPMVAMGLAAIGVGMGMGAASRAIPAGGGKAASTGTPQLAPATPVALDRTGGNAGPTTIVVNVPTVLSASGEDGKRIADAVAQAQREGRL